MGNIGIGIGDISEDNEMGCEIFRNDNENFGIFRFTSLSVSFCFVIYGKSSAFPSI